MLLAVAQPAVFLVAVRASHRVRVQEVSLAAHAEILVVAMIVQVQPHHTQPVHNQVVVLVVVVLAAHLVVVLLGADTVVVAAAVAADVVVVA